MNKRGVIRIALGEVVSDAVYSAVSIAGQHIVDNALFYASAQYTADAALYRDRVGFSDLVRARISQAIESLPIGIMIETDEVQAQAPLYVRPAFDEVTSAWQTRQTKISEAESYARGVTNNAIGQATAIVNDGQTRSNELVKTVAAEAQRFTDQLPHYRANPELFRKRLLSESMRTLLTNAQLEKFYLPIRADGRTRELRLLLSREPERGKTEAEQPH